MPIISVGNHPCLVSMLHIDQFYAWYKQRTAWKAPLQLSQPLHNVWKICLSKCACQLSISEKQVFHYPLFAAILSMLCSTYFKQRIVQEVPLLCYVAMQPLCMFLTVAMMCAPQIIALMLWRKEWDAKESLIMQAAVGKKARYRTKCC